MEWNLIAYSQMRGASQGNQTFFWKKLCSPLLPHHILSSSSNHGNAQIFYKPLVTAESSRLTPCKESIRWDDAAEKGGQLFQKKLGYGPSGDTWTATTQRSSGHENSSGATQRSMPIQKRSNHHRQNFSTSASYGYN
jgi:hypothetical protein